MTASPIRLGVNVDHVATVRNARGGRHPDPVKAAEIAIAAGADGITAHLREDRRHIVDDDIVRLKARITKPLNLEMAATAEMVGIACELKPACRLHRARAARRAHHRRRSRRRRPARGAARLRSASSPAAGIRVSLFIAAEPAQIEAADAIGAPVIEIHTGAWCDALGGRDAAAAAAEFERIERGAAQARSAGLEVHAGHGLDFITAETIAALAEIVELNIGHFLIGEAIFAGLRAAVRQMRAAMDRGRANCAAGTCAMILGIGSDITDVRRIAKVHRAPRRPLPRPHLHADRARQAPKGGATGSKPTPSASPPRRPAPRRLGTGFRAGVWWRDMGVVNLPSGRPTMELTGGAKRRLEAITPEGYEARIDLTITDEGPMAHAFVIISAVAFGGEDAPLTGPRVWASRVR